MDSILETWPEDELDVGGNLNKELKTRYFIEEDLARA